MSACTGYFSFGAIKVSNVSVTLGCLASGTLFASLLEPMVFKRRIYWFEVITGVVIIFGLISYFPIRNQVSRRHYFFADRIFSFLHLFTVLNKRITFQYNQNVIGFYEMIGGFAGISIYLLINGNFNANDLRFTGSDFVYLWLLAIFCTAYSFSAVVRLLKEISAYAVVLSINLEPVYGIVLAYFIFGSSEYMTLGFYIGTLILLLSIFSYPLLERKFKKDKQIGN